MLRGHSEGCTGFVWLETRSSKIEDSNDKLKNASRSNSLSPSMTGGHSVPNSTSGPMLSVVPSKLAPLFSSKGKKNAQDHYTSGRDSHQENKNAVGDVRSGIIQHLFTVGKDGNVLVQDIRNAYFPRKVMQRLY